MSLLPSLLQIIPSLMSGFKGVKTGPQNAVAGQLGQIANAQMNTNNPTYQQIYGQQKQQGQQNLGESIAEMIRQNRKASALHRTPLFDAERGGETLFRGVNQGYQDIQNQAGTNTQNILGGAARTLVPQYLMNQQTSQTNYSNDVLKDATFNNLGAALKHIFG